MKKEYIIYISMVFAIVVTTGFHYLLPGLSGDMGDMMYHMLRIESVKEALLSGTYPVRINSLFFNGYGYGSSLFYPDIFLILPAFLE